MAIAQDTDMPGYGVFEKEAWGFKVRICSEITDPCSHNDHSMTD